MSANFFLTFPKRGIKISINVVSVHDWKQILFIVSKATVKEEQKHRLAIYS